MGILDSLEADHFYECLARVLIAGAPDEGMRDEARRVMGSELGWRVAARVLAEVSPCVLRQGDHSAWSRVAGYAVGTFYEELATGSERLAVVETLPPYVEHTSLVE